MSIINPQRSDNLKAGALVIVAIMIFVFGTLLLAGGPSLWRRTSAYTVRFSLSSGAPGLVSGSDVLIGGRSVGRVKRVDLAFDNPDRPPIGVDVFISIERNIPVYTDAIAFLERPLFGSSSVLNFPSLGGEAGSSRLTAGGSIQGLIAPPELLRNAGYGSEQSEQLKSILGRLDELSGRSIGMADSLDKDILPELKVVTGDFRTLLSDFRKHADSWFRRADSFTEDLSTISSEAQSGIKEARAFIADIDDLVKTNRESFDTTVAAVESASKNADAMLDRMNNESIALLNDMLTDGRQRLDEAGDVVEKLSLLLAEQEPDIRTTVTNLRQSSEQLKLTMGEVRRSPWRLLYRPKTHELEYELLYDSARTYASAVSDLRAASESLESVLGSDNSRLATEGQPLDLYIEEIRNAFEQYKNAEKTFLDTLVKQGGPSGK